MSEDSNDPWEDGDESEEVKDEPPDTGDEMEDTAGPEDDDTAEESQNPPSFDEIPDRLKSDTAPESVGDSDQTTDSNHEDEDNDTDEGAATTEVTQTFDETETSDVESDGETDSTPEPNLDEDDLRDGLSSTSSFGFSDVDVSRRNLLLGAGGAALGMFSGGFFGGVVYEKARLAKERRDLKQEYQRKEESLAERREQLQIEYTTPTTEDKVIRSVDETVTVPIRNFRSFSLKFEKETLLTYDVQADDHIDIMVLQADEYANYRSKEEFRVRDRYSEMDTTVTTVSEVIPPGWYFLVLDHSETGVAKPDMESDDDVTAEVALKAYQQSESPEESANNTSN